MPVAVAMGVGVGFYFPRGFAGGVEEVEVFHEIRQSLTEILKVVSLFAMQGAVQTFLFVF